MTKPKCSKPIRKMGRTRCRDTCGRFRRCTNADHCWLVPQTAACCPKKKRKKSKCKKKKSKYNWRCRSKSGAFKRCRRCDRKYKLRKPH